MQALSGGGPAGRVDVGGGAPPLALDRPVGAAELRAAKRAFMRMATQGGCGVRITGRATATRSFADYLRGHLEG